MSTDGQITNNLRALVDALTQSVRYMQIDTMHYVRNGVTEELRFRCGDDYLKSIETIRCGLQIAKKFQS